MTNLPKSPHSFKTKTMVVKFDVKFDNNPNGIYFAGQVRIIDDIMKCLTSISYNDYRLFHFKTLSGIVELTINKPKKLRGN